MMLHFFMMIVSFFAVARIAFAEEKNFCQDETAILAWQQLAKEVPNDLEIQRLHALRVEICEKIKSGSLSLDQGMQLFEIEREKDTPKDFKKNLIAP